MSFQRLKSKDLSFTSEGDFDKIKSLPFVSQKISNNWCFLNPGNLLFIMGMGAC